MSKRDVEVHEPKTWRNEAHASREHRVAAPSAIGTPKYIATEHVHDNPRMSALGAKIDFETATGPLAFVA